MSEEIKHPTTQNVKTAEDKGRCAPAPGSALPDARLLVRDLRNALAAAMRVIARNYAAEEFVAEAKQNNIPDGLGVTSQQWLDAHSPNDQAQAQPLATRSRLQPQRCD